MFILWPLVGAILCLMVEQSYFSLLVGIFLGLLWARQEKMQQQLRELSRASQKPLAPPEASAALNKKAPATVTPPASQQPSTQSPKKDSGLFEPLEAVVNTSTKSASNTHVSNAHVSKTRRPVVKPASRPNSPSLFDRLINPLQHWFSTGNVPVKIGVLVLFAGVAALLKYTADSWLTAAPIWLRLSVVALLAIAALAFALLKRERHRTFSLAAQGGAIGVLVLVVFSAFQFYALLSSPVAFVLLLILVLAAGALAVWQDAVALAVLALLAGYAAPLLVSTGQGNYIVLFSYYTLLNLAVFGVGWYRAWRWLNLLGFVATFVVATAWGVLNYESRLFATTEPFLVVNFLIYLVIPWLYLRQKAGDNERVMDASLLFGNPLVCLLLQGALLDWQATPMAITAIVVAIVYAIAAIGMRGRLATGLLSSAWSVLAVVFISLAVPLIFGSSLTSCIFALEGAGLIWLGIKQQRILPHWGGFLLQGLAGLECLLAFEDWHGALYPFINPLFLSAMLIVGAGAVSCWLYVRASRLSWGTTAAVAWFLWALLWWLLAWQDEIARVLYEAEQWAGTWTLCVVTAWLAAEVANRLQAGRLKSVAAWGSTLLSAVTLPIVLLCLFAEWQPFAGWWLLALGIMLLTGWRTLVCLSSHQRTVMISQGIWWWRWALLVGTSLSLVADALTSWWGVWEGVAFFAPLLLLWWLVLRKPALLAVPLRQLYARTSTGLLYSLGFVLLWVFLVGLFNEGSAFPLPFVPLLNPLELLLVGIFAGCSYWLFREDAPLSLGQYRAVLVGVGGMLLITSMTLRAVHQLAGVAWDGDAMMESSLAQMSLSLVWSIFGVAAWLWGSHRKQRQVWLAGAIAMGVVLLKLLLVDREHLGNLFGIGSFIVYGLLCTVIGYLAPVPPKQAVAPTELE